MSRFVELVRGRGMRRPEPRESGQDVAFEVRRADGTVEFDAGTDGHSILVERVRALVRSLAKLDPHTVHSRPVLAFFCTGKANRSGELETSPTVLSPTDPEVSGGLAFSALLSYRKHDPAGFAVLMRRLRDAGV